ncbi:hypothetical protein [Candidatus Leptofilum sp.]|uniref:hypothetical protein n=1 Tax=Candidatus Leptofilum sp. TaxID=3241576 RepID=UPI003B5905A8
MNAEKPQQGYDNNPQIRTAVNRLTELLEWLHPDPSPDVFTVRDYRNRYPFTRLGALATEDIDRYQRINRAIGDHVQIGLCEYHIGLIYLHEAAFHGAVQQFELARQQWSFVSQPAGVSLTHLARAVALMLSDHYEAALVSVGRVETWLARARFAKSMPRDARFEEKVTAYVAELQAALRKLMDERPKTEKSARDKPQDDPEQEQGEEAHEAPTQPDPEAETKAEGEVNPEAETRPPIVNIGPNLPILPIPGHRQTTERYEWYVVEVRPASGFMPEINSGDWLLVDMHPTLDGDVRGTAQPILVVKDRRIEGTILVRPLEPRGRQRIYLATLDNFPTDDSPTDFWRDAETGTVTFSSEKAHIDINRNEILGVVVGFWRPILNFEQIPA